LFVDASTLGLPRPRRGRDDSGRDWIMQGQLIYPLPAKVKGPRPPGVCCNGLLIVCRRWDRLTCRRRPQELAPASDRAIELGRTRRSQRTAAQKDRDRPLVSGLRRAASSRFPARLEQPAGCPRRARASSPSFTDPQLIADALTGLPPPEISGSSSNVTSGFLGRSPLVADPSRSDADPADAAKTGHGS